ncbi:MAG: CHRD domain-containing protein [Saprospiraceae bacterium]|nr:CHRD domain-containing protein [Saprospiraceae bacterium]
MMKNYILTLFCVFALSALLSGQDFRAILSGNHQSTPVLTMSSGEIEATLTDDTLKVSGSFQDMSSGIDTSIAGGVHIHTGIAGRNGGIASLLNPTLSDGLTGGTFEAATNTIILDEEMKQALNERRLYVNIHSNDYGGGELRGQLLPNAEEFYAANLFGSNASNPVMSEGSGLVVLELTGNTVTLSGSFTNLSSALAVDIAGGIHIHQARAGSNGGVLQALTVELSDDSLSATIPADSNTYTFTDEEIANLKAFGWYINIHSANIRSGELRGQLTPMSTAKFRANLSGANENPPVNTYAHGKAVLTYDAGSLTVGGSFADLESDINVDIAGGAHIHLGMTGRNGGLVFPLTLDIGDDNRSANIDPAANTFAVSGDTLAALMGRALYINVHTLNNGGGEIRGQIAPQSQYFMNARLVASQQGAAVASTANGAVLLEVLGDKVTASGTFNDLSSPLAVNVAGGAHIHFAPAGANGGVVYRLMATPDDDANSGRFRAADNAFDITATRKDSVRGRLAYVNVHSDNYGGGEIRGQFVHDARAYFYTPLSGAGQTPAVNTTARGAAIMEYTGSNAIISGSFSQLSSALATQTRGGAHLHFGMAGSSGPIITDLAVTSLDSLNGVFRPANNNYSVSEGWMDTVRNRMTYINVHSANYGGGEIRGNFRPLAQTFYLANLRGKNAANPIASTGAGAVLVEQTGNRFVTSGSFSNLSGDFNGGAHIHLGMAGLTGGVLIPLVPQAGADAKSASFLADSNSTTVPDSVSLMIQAGNTYANIHSTTVGSGEIRGQVLPEVNLAPDQVAFLSPESGDTITIGGDLTMTFSAEWEEATDPNSNKVVYIWQLSTTPDFANPAIAINTGENASFTTTFGAVDTLLGLLGIDSGAVITVYHRVVSSDGSLCSEATVDSVVLIKGTTTSVRENPYFDQVFALYPSPTTGQFQVEIDMKQTANGIMQIIDLDGKVVDYTRTSLLAGRNIIQQDVSRLQPGSYIARLVVNQKVSAAKRFTKL